MVQIITRQTRNQNLSADEPVRGLEMDEEETSRTTSALLPTTSVLATIRNGMRFQTSLACALGSFSVADAHSCLHQSDSLYKSMAFCRVTLRLVSSEMPSNC